MATYIEAVPNRSSPPAILLRESYHENGKVKKRTIANLSKWSPTLVEGLRILLKGGTAVRHLDDAFDIVRSLPHGHVAAVLGTLKKLGLDRLIDPKPSPERDQVLAMIVARILEPASKLATAVSTLGEVLDAEMDEDALYGAMDWLLERQERIERSLAKRRLEEGCLVLHDLTSVWMEGRACPLARRGHSRDGKKGKLQIEFGLLCDRDGCPVSVEVFPRYHRDRHSASQDVGRSLRPAAPGPFEDGAEVAMERGVQLVTLRAGGSARSARSAPLWLPSPGRGRGDRPAPPRAAPPCGGRRRQCWGERPGCRPERLTAVR